MPSLPPSNASMDMRSIEKLHHSKFRLISSITFEIRTCTVAMTLPKVSYKPAITLLSFIKDCCCLIR